MRARGLITASRSSALQKIERSSNPLRPPWLIFFSTPIFLKTVR